MKVLSRFQRLNLASLHIWQIFRLTPSFQFRVLTSDPHNIEALKYNALHTLCRQGNYEESSQQIQDIYNELNKSEPNNAPLFIHMAQLFSRVVRKFIFS